MIILPALSNIYSILYKHNHQLKVNEIHRNVFIRPLRLFINLSEKSYFLYQNIQFQNHVKSVPPNWTILDAEKDKDIYVFIIGESVRKDFMQIYNPSLKNTPFLDSIPKLKFNAVTAYAGNTIESLSNAFIQNKGYLFFPNNVVTLAQKNGYAVDWISNQGSLGKHDNQIASIAKLANSIKFITKGVYTTHKDDLDLLPLFNEALSDSNTPKIIFLHTIGSHPSPCDITKGKYDTKYKSEDISCYIQSIKDTDAFIAEIYKSLIKSKKTFKIVYFSDHGLTIKKNVSLIKNNTFIESNSLHHDEYFKENYDIPLVILDDEYKSTSQINARRNLKDFLLLYSELLKIKTKEIKSPFTFISDDIQTNADSLFNNKYYPKLKNNIYEF
jgi:glucan phosphoethanolaminetransferase (alkaline phosphatase superfamily)